MPVDHDFERQDAIDKARVEAIAAMGEALIITIETLAPRSSSLKRNRQLITKLRHSILDATQIIYG